MEEGLKINQEIPNQDLATPVCCAEADSLPESDDLLALILKSPAFSKAVASALEPMLRTAVSEEVCRLLKQYFPSLVPQNQALETPLLKLVFSMDPSLPIFTGHKILDPGHNPLQINLVDINYNRSDPIIAISRDPPPKVELVVLNGDFPPRGHDSWTSQEFDDNIVKERNGKAPLIIGDLIVTLKHGVATFGDIKFTDNSSWIPTKKFKIGARLVAPGTHAAFQGRVLEAITEVPFVVREYRMGSFNFFLNEAFKKHHPPNLDDYVWRLEKIAKNGAFHKKLASEGIHTVKDFLNQSATTAGQKRLREILGSTMSDKKWEVVLKHANTCKIENIIPHEQSSVYVQQEIVTEFAASLAQGTAMLEGLPNLNHIVLQANDELPDKIIFYDEGSTRLDELLASNSQLEFEVDN